MPQRISTSTQRWFSNREGQNARLKLTHQMFFLFNHLLTTSWLVSGCCIKLWLNLTFLLVSKSQTYLWQYIFDRSMFELNFRD